ncbi:hypothetical protein Tco_0152672 [Tanacetum coccineum]
MSTYLKNMAGYKHNQLKNKSFDDIQKLFEKAIKRVNTFVDMYTELVEGSEVRAEAHLAPKQPVQVNKITSSCEICSGPHGTQYCMEDPEQAFVVYTSSRTDEARSKQVTTIQGPRNFSEAANA